METVIKITLTDKNYCINKFNEDRISYELEEYIKSEMQIINLKDKIVIEIDSEFDMTDEEKEKIAFLIKNTYRDDIVEIRGHNKSLLIRDWVLLSLGTFLLVIYYFFENIKFINEYLIIIGGFFIWSALENILIFVMENRLKLIKKKQLLYSKIKFI